MSAESRHVLEISEKLANFNIDTDTDGNISTDVGKCWAFFTLQLLPMWTVFLCVHWHKEFVANV